MSLVNTNWKTLSQKNLIQNDHINVWEDKVLQPDGNEATYYVMKREPFCIVIPVQNESVFLVRQFRYSVSSLSLEFPMGGHIDGKSNQETAELELLQETGIRASSFQEIGKFWVACGRSNQEAYVYVAENLEFGEKDLDAGEFIETETYKISQVEELISTGQILDGPSIVAFHFFEQFLKNRKVNI
jgi:ADP-ribose pyrophosphatase